jgi:hypothetical protein
MQARQQGTVDMQVDVQENAYMDAGKLINLRRFP